MLKRHALFFIAITGAVHLVLMWRSNASIGHAQDSYKNVSAMVPPQVHLAPQCLKPKDGDNKRYLNTDGIPTVTVIIPIYKGSMYVRQLMKALIEQTYPCLEFLVAIEPTDDAHETFRILTKGIRIEASFFKNDDPSHETSIAICRYYELALFTR